MPSPIKLMTAGDNIGDQPRRRDYWCADPTQARALASDRARSLGPRWTVIHDAHPRPHYHLVRVTRSPDGVTTRRRVGARYFYGGRRPALLPKDGDAPGRQSERLAAHDGRRRGVGDSGPVAPLPAGPVVSPEIDKAWDAARDERENEGPAPGLDLQLRTALAGRRWSQAIAAAIAMGTIDEIALTDMIFFAAYPERRGKPIARHERAMARKWVRIRDTLVRPAVRSHPQSSPTHPADPTGSAGVARSTKWLRRAWAEYLGEKTVRMVPLVMFGLPPTPVHPYTVDAWRAMERALTTTGYRPRSVWNYNNRPITGGTGPSLHAYGIATDVDPACNPYRVTPAKPLVRFSAQPTQQQRCAEVKAGLADTAFTQQQVGAVEAISTVDGLQVITWGGRFQSVKDAMHFQINVSPDELRRGLRTG